MRVQAFRGLGKADVTDLAVYFIWQALALIWHLKSCQQNKRELPVLPVEHSPTGRTSSECFLRLLLSTLGSGGRLA